MLLLLEDLKDFKTVPAGSFVSEEDAIDITKALARMHALYWNTKLAVIRNTNE